MITKNMDGSYYGKHSDHKTMLSVLKKPQRYIRQIPKQNNIKCSFPEKLKKIYCHLKEEDKNLTNLGIKCKKEGAKIKVIDFTIQDNNNLHPYNEPCLQSLEISIRRINYNLNCKISEDSISVGNCFCNAYHTRTQYYDNMQCLCELRMEPSRVYQSYLYRTYHYSRHTCQLKGPYGEWSVNSLTCDIQDRPYPFENSYFNSSRILGNRHMNSICNLANNPRNNIIYTNPLEFLLLLMLHLLLYYILFEKGVSKDEKRKGSEP